MYQTYSPTRCLQPLGPPSVGAIGQGSEGGGLYALAGTAATLAGAYHGYRRHGTVGWAVVWGLLGGAFWPIAMPVAVAQGFGERK